jgi:PAS domain S-box-containing protein
MERQKELLRVTLLSIGDGVIITDVVGRIILMNKVAEELTGWDLGEADSVPCEAVFRIINEDSRQTVESPVSKVLREGTIAGLANHTLLIKRDGTTIPIDDSGAPIRDVSGVLRGVVLVFRDFSAYKSAEKKLRDTADELDAANSAKNQFFARLSHELRTPLTPVLATLSLWEGRDEFPEQLRGDVQMMRRNIELETRLIDELIDVNRIMRGTVSLKPERTDAHELISSVLKMYSSEIYSHGLSVITDLAAQQHSVNVDRDRVQQAFWNILKNAAAHTPSGGRIVVRSFNDGPNVCISFRDTGIGMSSETIQMLFKPFEGRNGGNPNGLGLGLSISRALIVQQGGDITASSEGQGLGSEFRVTLPTVDPQRTKCWPSRS